MLGFVVLLIIEYMPVLIHSSSHSSLDVGENVPHTAQVLECTQGCRAVHVLLQGPGQLWADDGAEDGNVATEAGAHVAGNSLRQAVQL